MNIIRSIDFETTGLLPTDAVCEAAFVDVVRPDKITAAAPVALGTRWSSLIDPLRPIPPETSAIHHILDEDVKGAPGFEDAVDQMMAGPPVAFAAHGAAFEQQFFNTGNIPWLCTLKIARKIWFEAPSHSAQCLRYFLKMDVPRDMLPHRAAPDALIAAHIIMLAFAHGLTANDMSAITRAPSVLRTMPFGKHFGMRFDDVPGGYLDWCLKQSDLDEDVRHTAFVHLTRRREQGIRK